MNSEDLDAAQTANNKLVETALISLTNAYYVAKYDIETKANMIAAHYQDEPYIIKQTESFRTDIQNIKARLQSSLLVTQNVVFKHFEQPHSLWPLTYYLHHFLFEVGMHTLGEGVRLEEEPEYSEPDEFYHMFKNVSDKLIKENKIPVEYIPRKYVPMKDRPIRAFDVLDKFSDSIFDAIK